MTTIRINIDPDTLRDLARQQQQITDHVDALAFAMAASLSSRAANITPSIPGELGAQAEMRRAYHAAGSLRPSVLHANCRCVVMPGPSLGRPIETDYIESDYTVGDGTRIAGLLGTDGP